MRHIGSVMERSLVPERSIGEALMSLAARSVAAGFMKRDIIGDAKGQAMDVQKAFSSWDNCMQAVYCKWPVIGVIIRSKYLDEPFIPPHHAENQAYRSQAPMYAPTTAPTMVPAVAPSFAKAEPPHWEGASSKQVLVEEDAVELEPMKKPDPMQNASMMGAGVVSPGGVSPASGTSPYGPPSQTGPNGYMAAARPDNNMYSMNGNGSGQVYNGSYGQASRDNMNQGYGNQPYGDQSGQGYDQNYGMLVGAVAAAGAMGQGRRTPHQDYNNGNGGYGAGQMNQGYSQSQTPRPYEDYSRSITPSNAAYGHPTRKLCPPATWAWASSAEYLRCDAADAARPPQRSYTDVPPPVSPIQNTGGFDFVSG
ncbi:hypothetical protein PG994_010770 [Apiospora phragmitis]|uniref:Uncharacterized protein n=1 Tax=Apiospora phragmitis TaxID=2905665 RepID=A0ABR1TT64_9PEZI